MKRFLVTSVLIAIFTLPAYAGLWEDNCASCHNGKVAPSRETILQKYKTINQFMTAVRNAVSSGKMERGIGYRLVGEELYGGSPYFKGKGKGKRQRRPGLAFRSIEITGKITNIEKSTGFGRKNKSRWWIINIKTNNKTIKVWLATTKRLPSVNLKPGDEVKVKAFIPRPLQGRKTKEVMACLVNNETTGGVLDFSFKPPCKKLK